jgi:L-alanine-DL-glutamate epimerase-like enolase superfamily enzyme
VIEETLAPRIIGTDALDVDRAWQKMTDAVRNVGRPGVASMAIAAVDIGLWDLKAKLFDVPLVQLLGATRDSVEVYGSGGFTSLTEKELCDQLSGWVEQGIGRVKMKIGTDWGARSARDVKRVAAARRAIGPSASLFVDANGGYSVKQATRLCAEFERHDVCWFEEPVSSDDLEGLHMVRSATSMDVTAGEYGFDAHYFERMVRAGSVDVVQLDVSRCAGISEWFRAAAVAAAAGLPISGHCAQSLHVHPACAVRNLRHLEYFADHAYVDRELFEGVLDPVDGALRPDVTRPGLGLELRSDSERYRVH